MTCSRKRDRSDVLGNGDEPPACTSLQVHSNSIRTAALVCRVTQTSSFDTEVALSTHATSFVVVKVRGLILTSYHVGTPDRYFLDLTLHLPDMNVKYITLYLTVVTD